MAVDITEKASICQVNELLREINSVCGCVPSYMATVKDFPWIAHAKECSFGKHAGCVALIKVLVDLISGHVRHGRGHMCQPLLRIIIKKMTKSVCLHVSNYQFTKKQCM